MTTPAMRILVLKLCLGHEYAPLLEQLDDGFVRLKNSFAFVFGKAVAHSAGFIHVASLVELVLCASVEVVRTVGGSGMHCARSLIGGYIVGEHAQDLSFQEGMV